MAYDVTYNEVKHQLRNTSLRIWLFGELEIAKYEVAHLDSILVDDMNTKILRIAVAIYNNDFNTYCEVQSATREVEHFAQFHYGMPVHFKLKCATPSTL
jgi:hypothetical protein